MFPVSLHILSSSFDRCLSLAAIISKSSSSDSLLLKVITSTLLNDFEGSERDKLDPADITVKPDVGPDLKDPFDLINPNFYLFCPGTKLS